MKILKIRDWHNFDDVGERSVVRLPWARVRLCNSILSQARVIITDRLHVSVLCVLMGKPHVMINDKYKKVQNTRETAFRNKPECSDDNLRGYYVENINQAVDKALWLLGEID